MLREKKRVGEELREVVGIVVGDRPGRGLAPSAMPISSSLDFRGGGAARKTASIYIGASDRAAVMRASARRELVRERDDVSEVVEDARESSKEKSSADASILARDD